MPNFTQEQKDWITKVRTESKKVTPEHGAKIDDARRKAKAVHLVFEAISALPQAMRIEVLEEVLEVYDPQQDEPDDA